MVMVRSIITLILPLFFVMKMLSGFYVCCVYSSALKKFRIDFFREANNMKHIFKCTLKVKTRFCHGTNNMNPDLTAPKGAVRPGFILFVI